MMRFYFLCCVISITAYCAPIDESQASIVSYEYNNDGSGNYNFSYTTSNGISRQERGNVVNKGTSDERIEVIGSYSYVLPNGQLESIQYTADQNGFKFSKQPSVIAAAPALNADLISSLLGK